MTIASAFEIAIKRFENDRLSAAAERDSGAFSPDMVDDLDKIVTDIDKIIEFLHVGRRALIPVLERVIGEEVRAVMYEMATEPPEPNSVREAIVNVLRANGPTRYADIVRLVRRDYPYLDKRIKNLEKTVSNALDFGMEHGHFEKVTRGIYRLSRKEVIGPTNEL